MDRAEFLSKYVKFGNGDEVIKFKTTDENDVVSLSCLSVDDYCAYEVNGDSEKFLKDDLKVMGLEVDLGGGDDRIKISIPKGMTLQAVQILPGEGNNRIEAKFVSPRSSGSVVLGNGNNTLIFDEEGSNLFVKWGFRNSSGNKILVKSAKYAFSDVEVLRESSDSEVFDVYLRSQVSGKKKQLCSVNNHFSPKEYERYGECEAKRYGGEKVPSDCQDEPHDLSLALNSDFFVFSDFTS